MSGCATKTTWRTLSEAHREARRLEKKHGMGFKAYHCSVHQGFHTAKRYQTVEYSQYITNAKRNSERLAGKLVQALRLVLDKD